MTTLNLHSVLRPILGSVSSLHWPIWSETSPVSIRVRAIILDEHGKCGNSRIELLGNIGNLWYILYFFALYYFIKDWLRNPENFLNSPTVRWLVESLLSALALRSLLILTPKQMNNFLFSCCSCLSKSCEFCSVS